MTGNKLWKKIDIADNSRPSLCENDICYYTREFIIGGGYEASPANQQIVNFKIEVKNRGTSRWPHKESAIRQFASELSSAIGGNCIITFIPTSKHKSDTEYDSRFEDTCKLAATYNTFLRFEEPIVLKKSVLAAHLGGTRIVDDIYNSYEWRGFNEKPFMHMIIIDDVITTGSHFRAYKRLIHEHYPEMQIAGFFWTKAIY